MSVEDQTLFLQQLTNANIHSTSSWHRELEIAKALKIAQDDENYEDEATGLEKLGDVHAERAGLDHKSSSFETNFARLDQIILATALYNSSFVRTTQDEKRYELNAKLRQLEDEILKKSGENINKRDFKYDIDRDHKRKLDEFRETCREKLNSVQNNFNVFTSPLHDTDTASEERRAIEIEQLFIEIQAFVKEFVSGLLDECVEVLGSAPEGVSYAFVAFGSFPRKEVTPYSDLESAVLIKIEGDKDTSSYDVKEYFVKLTEYFNFKVLNLQETILPAMSIASLNDLNDEMNSLESLYKCTNEERCNNDQRKLQEDSSPDEDRDWFYDNQMRGFSVDGRMSKACKTPLGCLVQGRGRSNDLIKTPEEMAELYIKSLRFDRDVSQRKREGNDYNLSTVLSNVSFLYGNDRSLVDMYDGLVMSLTEATDGDTSLNHRQASAVGCLRDALEEFKFSLNVSDIGLISSIKKKLYRVVDLLLVNLGKLQYPGVVDNSPWDILRRLRKDDRISPQAFHNLMVVLGIVNEVRLMAYLRSGRQDELVSFFDQSMDIDYELTKDLFLRFFYTVVPLQRAVKNLILSGESENNAVEDILFPQDEKFYEYSHLTCAIAMSFTSYRFFHEVMAKFQEALCSAEDESSQRLCLAFLSCLHPGYSIQYCNKLLSSTPSSEDEESSDWRIFSFLVASLASFHQDNIDGNVEKFLAAATSESSRVPVTNASSSCKPSRAQVVVQSYEILVRGLLKLNRQSDYEEALREFEAARVMYERNTQSKRAKSSAFAIFCDFMSGRCRIQLGNFQDSSIETAMRCAEIYTGNGQYMRLLYHAYMGMVCLQQGNQDALVAKHCEKILELFLRFQCPKGQELWASIPAQSVALVALFLGLLYQKMERVDDALRIFHLSSTRLISKALEFCEEKHHVGNDSFETAKMYVDALRAVFSLLKAECLYRKGREEEMWTQLGEAVAQLAKYRGKFKPVELREEFPDATTMESSAGNGVKKDPAVWRMNLDSEPLTPPIADVFTMQPLLETWCDKITMVIQYILYTIERDVYGQLIQQGTPIISLLALLSSNASLLEQFQSNPCAVLEVIMPVLRQNSYAGQVVSGLFESTNAQRTAMFGKIRTSITEIVRYAVEFADGFVELALLCLRLLLCHDLVNAFGMFW